MQQQSFRSFGDWDNIQSLGEGGFGEVYRWRNKFTGQEIATKSLKPKAKFRPDELVRFKNRWIQEYNWIQELEIPYIVGAVTLSDSTFLAYLNGQHFYKNLPVIVMEYCNGGDLRSIMERKEHFNGLHEHDIRAVLKTLRHAVEYLHVHCKIEHRDIKPENIVLNLNGDVKHYKLTDFGYAREIPEATLEQSVVGTRHYVAPEVIHPGSYKNTVDYWSVGVVIFEIICGIRPFIPHREFKDILTNVLEKPVDCIAITEAIDPTGAFNFENNLFPQNQCSPIFIEKIEKWLKLALDTNYKTRGSDQNGNLKFYTDLDKILESKILSVFSLSSYEFFYYDVNAFETIVQFFEKLALDSNVPQKSMYITLPTLHPLQRLEYAKHPADFYVPEWSDTSNLSNPPVMLYIADVKKHKCDYNVNKGNETDTIMKCINIDQQMYHEVPIWFLEQFERHVGHILSKYKHHLDCYVKGLYESVMSMEQDVFLYEPTIEKIHSDVLILCGRIKQFQRTVQMSPQSQNSQKWLEIVGTYQSKYETHKEMVASIARRYKSVRKHCHDLADAAIFKKFSEEDIYGVGRFRDFIQQTRNTRIPNADRMTECLKFFDECNNVNQKFSRSPIVPIHDKIVSQYDMFLKIQDIIKGVAQSINKLENDLDAETKVLLRWNFQNNADDHLSMKMESLNMVDNCSVPFSLLNGDGQMNGFQQTDTSNLIQEAEFLTNSISAILGDNNSMPMCVDDNNTMAVCADDNMEHIPMTVKDI
ncbi:inhibitor of nuclear factor kappa-B kinase subunit beta [Stomoxys calcitrans]|uniref:inhibitor of nuclear factor kappa-B kinase subunit beta n=1 Tax=Stomoxys calcitrans TaxID=35570 RepID=UPI0027E26DB9|nr:inhibitor of nuclear factor kappa-B kinase subunit beta [Stomoxys calcitrans]